MMRSLRMFFLYFLQMFFKIFYVFQWERIGQEFTSAIFEFCNGGSFNCKIIVVVLCHANFPFLPLSGPLILSQRFEFIGTNYLNKRIKELHATIYNPNRK